ncbi:MAG: GntR family transcriptional regulator [Spirochaetes bacterium]|nr:GntR family transcriptional regulator [Spirochaetota bacterium]
MPDIKYRHLKEIIKAKIAEGLWLPGSRILPERKIAEEFQISRVTVKKAISDLISEGLLERLSGKRGAFVREYENVLGNRRLIGVAIDDASDFFGATLLRGIEDYLWGRKFLTVICNADRNFEKVEKYFESLFVNNISGVIFSPVIDKGYVKNNLKIIKFLEQKKLPFVLVDRYIPGVMTNQVVSNHRESSKNIIKHFFNMGYKRILVVKGLKCSSMDDRLQGYMDAHREANIPVDENLIIRVNDNLIYKMKYPHEMAKMKDQIKKAGDFNVFYALNGRILNAGISILKSLNVQIGKDVQLAVHDFISNPVPPYTDNIPHIVQPTYQMGLKAAWVLLESMKMPENGTVQVTLRSKLII